MIAELKGLLSYLTESEYFGTPPNPTETYYAVVVRKYLDLNQEVKEKEYAIKVFVNGNKNTRTELEYFVNKLVTVQVNISSRKYKNKNGKDDFMQNFTLNKISVTENTTKQPTEKKDEGQLSMQEVKPEQSEIAKSIDNDDLPF